MSVVEQLRPNLDAPRLRLLLEVPSGTLLEALRIL